MTTDGSVGKRHATVSRGDGLAGPVISGCRFIDTAGHEG